MKKLTYFMVAAVVLVMASCAKPSEKAAGTYNGNANINSTDYACVTTVTADGDNKANISATANSTTYNVNGVSLTLNNDVVTFSYTSNTTTSGEATAVNGTVTGNALALTITVMVFNPTTT